MLDLEGSRAHENAARRLAPRFEAVAPVAAFSALSEDSVHAGLFGVAQAFHLVLEMELASFQLGDFEIGFVTGSCGFDFAFEGRVLVLKAGQLR